MHIIDIMVNNSPVQIFHKKNIWPQKMFDLIILLM